jgi:hypothetical protein
MRRDTSARPAMGKYVMVGFVTLAIFSFDVGKTQISNSLLFSFIYLLFSFPHGEEGNACHQVYLVRGISMFNSLSFTA